MAGSKLTITNEDNLQLMARYPDNYFELAIVDVPYGIKEDGHRENNRSKLAKSKDYHKALWDQSRPTKDYFNELIRVSKNQIIWGANHLCDIHIMNSPAWIVWNKDNHGSNFADCELAYSSFESAVRMFTFTWNGMLQGDMKNKEHRIHPTQKPVKLYEWLLMKYAKKGDKILDSHLGSGSIAIACHNLEFDLTACELDKDYYEAAMKRINNHTAQLQIPME